MTTRLRRRSGDSRLGEAGAASLRQSRVGAAKARYRDTIERELYTARRKLAADQRSLIGERNADNAAIRERGVRALINKVADLEREAEHAPQRPRGFAGDVAPPPGCTWARDTSYRQTPYSEAELEAARNDPSLDIPEFLRRQPT